MASHIFEQDFSMMVQANAAYRQQRAEQQLPGAEGHMRLVEALLKLGVSEELAPQLMPQRVQQQLRNHNQQQCQHLVDQVRRQKLQEQVEQFQHQQQLIERLSEQLKCQHIQQLQQQIQPLQQQMQHQQQIQPLQQQIQLLQQQIKQKRQQQQVPSLQQQIHLLQQQIKQKGQQQILPAPQFPGCQPSAPGSSCAGAVSAPLLAAPLLGLSSASPAVASAVPPPPGLEQEGAPTRTSQGPSPPGTRQAYVRGFDPSRLDGVRATHATEDADTVRAAMEAEELRLRTLVVGKFPRCVSDEALADALGTLVGREHAPLCRIAREKSGRSLCYAFAEFHEERFAQLVREACDRGELVMLDESDTPWQVTASAAKRARSSLPNPPKRVARHVESEEEKTHFIMRM